MVATLRGRGLIFLTVFASTHLVRSALCDPTGSEAAGAVARSLRSREPFVASRMIQYDLAVESSESRAGSNDGEGVLTDDSVSLEPRGAIESTFDLPAGGYADGMADGALKRRCAVISAGRFNPKALVDAVGRLQASAVLVILPSQVDNEGNDENSDDSKVEYSLREWSRAEAALAARKWDVPVYFVRSDDRISALYDEITAENGAAEGDNVQLVATKYGKNDGKKLASIPLANVGGWLTGRSRKHGKSADGSNGNNGDSSSAKGKSGDASADDNNAKSSSSSSSSSSTTSSSSSSSSSDGASSSSSSKSSSNASGSKKQVGASSRAIAVTAGYDILGLSPGLTTSPGRSVSGAAVLMEVARVFSRLYESSQSRGSRSIVFVLTGGASLGYAGARHWLSTTDARVLETVDAAICLDDIIPLEGWELESSIIGDEEEEEVNDTTQVIVDPKKDFSGDKGDKLWPNGSNGLYLHVSRKPGPKQPAAVAVHSSLRRAARALGVPLSLVHKKIDMSDPSVYWEHEQFSRKRIPAVTISAWPHARASLARSSLLDTRERLDMAALRRSARFVAESLAAYIYGLEESGAIGNVFEGSNAISDAYLDAAVGAFSGIARIPATLASSDAPEVLAKMLEQHAETSTHGFTAEPAGFELHDGWYANVSAYRVKGLGFDFFQLVVTVVYLFALFIVVRGKGAVTVLFNTFLSKSANKKNK